MHTIHIVSIYQQSCLCTVLEITVYGTTLHYVRNNPTLRTEQPPLRTEQHSTTYGKHSTTYGTTLHYLRNNPPLCTEPSTMYGTLHYVQNNPPLCTEQPSTHTYYKPNKSNQILQSYFFQTLNFTLSSEANFVFTSSLVYASYMPHMY